MLSPAYSAAAGLAAAALIAPAFAFVAAAYAALLVLYSVALKNIVIIDVLDDRRWIRAAGDRRGRSP